VVAVETETDDSLSVEVGSEALEGRRVLVNDCDGMTRGLE
jgi:hypothetical protein